MVTKFQQVISKEGETINHYVHSFESSRNSTTNLKVSKWAAAVEITAVVPRFIEEKDFGAHGVEYLLLLTETAVVRLDVIKWQDRYFDVALVENVYWKGALQYYKCHCYERVEFLGN